MSFCNNRTEAALCDPSPVVPVRLIGSKNLRRCLMPCPTVCLPLSPKMKITRTAGRLLSTSRKLSKLFLHAEDRPHKDFRYFVSRAPCCPRYWLHCGAMCLTYDRDSMSLCESEFFGSHRRNITYTHARAHTVEQDFGYRELVATNLIWVLPMRLMNQHTIHASYWLRSTENETAIKIESGMAPECDIEASHEGYRIPRLGNTGQDQLPVQ